MNHNVVSVARLREAFHYDPETGHLTWLIGNRKGQRAGSVNKSRGYRHVQLDGCGMSTHRLIWAMVHGEWPELTVDHANRDSLDDRLSNLRLATRRQQQYNRQYPNLNELTKGLRGVSVSRYGWRGQTRFLAKATVDGRTKHLGTYATPEAAHAAFAEVARVLSSGYIPLD